MNKVLKTVISLMLTAIITFSLVSSAFAKTGCDCGRCPVVFVHGVGSPLYEKDENGERVSVFMPETSVMVKQVLSAVFTLPIATLLGGWDRCADTISALCNGLFGEIRCDENGNSVNDIIINSSTGPSASRHLTGDNTFTFSYDWRLDPVENAGLLDKYIDSVLAATNHDKIVLYAFSEGGEVTLSYLAVYGSEKVEKYVTLCSAFQGLTLVGKLFSGEISFNSRELANFIGTILPAAAGVPKNVATFLKLLHYTGLYAVILAILNTAVEHCFDKFYYDSARQVFACMPGMFCFVPYEYYDAAIKYSFGNNKLKYAGLVEKLDRYHDIQGRAQEILQGCVDNGMQICIISNYDCYPMPFVGKDVYQSDGLIDSANTSGGATFAPIGKTFPAEYKQQINDGHDHLSPDGKVDASTCMFPESTWFISGFCHWNSPDSFIDWLISFKGQPTVFSSTEYPQFLTGDTSDDSVHAQTR